MAVRLFWDNTDFDSLPSGSLTPSSQSLNLPVTNVQNSFRTRVWRTGNTLGTESVIVDFGVPVTIDACIMFFTTVEGTVSPMDGPVTIAGNSSNSFSSPAFGPVTMQQGSITDSQYPEYYFFAAFGVSPGSPTYRYWQLKFTKASAGYTRDVGRVFLGQTYDLVQAPAYNGVQIDLQDNSNKSKGVGLNTYVEILPQFKVITLSFPPMTQADMDAIDAVFYQIGQNRSFFLQIDQTGPVQYTEIYYVKLAAVHTKKLAVVSPTTQYWSVSLQFEEQL